MTTKSRLRELSALTLPLLVEQTFIVLLGMMTTVMVSSIGEEALAAAGHINNASHLPIGLFTAMTTGGTILVSQAIGAQNYKKAAFSGGQSVTLTVAFALLLSVIMAIFRRPLINLLFLDSDPVMISYGYVYFTYLNISLPILAMTQAFFGVMRGSGDTKNPMKITLTMNAINIVLGYILIFGLHSPGGGFYIPSMGMHGAGLAILLAKIAGMSLAFFSIISKKSAIRLNKLSYFKPTWQMQKSILNLGIPTGMESTLFHVGRIISQMFVVGMGAAAMAANTVAFSISAFVNVTGTAMAISIMVLVGQRVGRGDIDDIPKTTSFSLLVTSVTMGIICLVLLPFSYLIAGVFNLEGDSVGYFMQIFVSFLIVSPFFWAFSFVLPAALRAVEDVKYTMAAAIISMWLCRIILGFVLGIALGLGVFGVWIAMYLDWVVRGLFFWVRLKRGKWAEKYRSAEAAV